MYLRIKHIESSLGQKLGVVECGWRGFPSKLEAFEKQ